MTDQAFCEALEYKLCEAFKNTRDENVKDFWCDGIVLSAPGNDYSQQFIKDNRYINMKAFVGKDGQTVYALTLKFGKMALSRYSENPDMAALIAGVSLESGLVADTLKREIIIQLD